MGLYVGFRQFVLVSLRLRSSKRQNFPQFPTPTPRLRTAVMDGRPPTACTIDIISDEDENEDSSLQGPPNKASKMDGEGHRRGRPPLTVVVIDDGVTPQKENPVRTTYFIPETPMSPGKPFDSDPSIVKCSLTRAKVANDSSEFSGVGRLICLESDNESELDVPLITTKKSGTDIIASTSYENSQVHLSSQRVEELKGSGVIQDCFPMYDLVLDNYNNNDKDLMKHGRDGIMDDNNETQIIGESPPDIDNIVEQTPFQTGQYSCCQGMYNKENITVIENHEGFGKTHQRTEAEGRKGQLKEKKLHLREERKRLKQQEKLQKEALKTEAAEAKKLEKERQKWGKGKFALKSMMAEIDAKIIENGSVGGPLLMRFAEKGLSFRITSNPIQRSILWKINAPDHITELSLLGSEVPYILLVHQAEEFCDLVSNGSLFANIQIVQNKYPGFTICYLTNKLMSYIKKCEQAQYKNPSNVCNWRRPPVEEVLSKLVTHYSKVHSRDCIDEAEVAETIVGLTFSLANCQFRKKPTWLSVHANGTIIPKDFIDRKLIKGSVWLKALIAIPKVQPRYAVAIWKKYPTMRSLLNVYMDPTKSVHEKEFLLKDLMIEGALGTEVRRLGDVCSKRVYRILMAQNGGIETDDVEQGADSFHP
ncbi:crossover junction endonuclease EME1B-like [Zingiber officinale]|uniref:crossover junction endonuclease EME1B-like n=1 Tax=Zingiber officinale TaxID=94328 RepID=UPI001C4D573D|nr:crossover junction endonuclease EME1B-like [Zingiber officinale]